jgi:hypothetical protein
MSAEQPVDTSTKLQHIVYKPPSRDIQLIKDIIPSQSKYLCGKLDITAISSLWMRQGQIVLWQVVLPLPDVAI